jgi:PAS domain S-box-containing protein
VIWYYQVYVVALLIAGIVALILSHSGWNLRNTKEGNYFALLMLCLLFWSFFQAFEVIAADLETKIILSKISYFGIIAVGPLFFIFILAYTQQFRKWASGKFLLLWLFPITIFFLVWTNEHHHLIWTNIELVQVGTQWVASYSHGFLVFCIAMYSYMLNIIGEFYLFSYSKRTTTESRKKIYLLMIGAAFPLLGSILYLFKIVPYPDMDLTPFAFLITGIFIALSVFKYRLLDIVPFALDLLFTSMTKGVLALDIYQRVVAINPSAQKLLHVSSRIIGMKLDEIFQEYPTFVSLFKQLSQKFVEFEIENLTESGWLSVRISPILSSKRSSNGLLIVIEDITKRKQTEKYLHESKERFEQVAEQAREIIWEVDANGLYTYISPKIETIVGYKAEEIVGKKHFYDFHPEDVQEAITEEVFRKFEKKEIFRDYINEVETRDGKRLFFSTNAIPILDGKNKLLGYRGSDFDITMIKKMEKVKDDFISTVSHELRTPLTIIKESINMVMKEYTGPLNQVQKETLLIGKRNVDRLSRLINDVLDIQKLQFDGFSMNFQSEDINQLALDIRENMISIIKEKGLDLQLNLAPDLQPVLIDRDRIIQVFTNLVNNAVKFTQHGFIRIKTELWEDRYVRVTIQDSGIGIAQEDKTKLFQRFSQIAPFDHQKLGSTGLGLAICKEIIEKHLGKIWVESTPGQGSSFFFTLLLTSITKN